jgi:hypothetical protein
MGKNIIITESQMKRVIDIVVEQSGECSGPMGGHRNPSPEDVKLTTMMIKQYMDGKQVYLQNFQSKVLRINESVPVTIHDCVISNNLLRMSVTQDSGNGNSLVFELVYSIADRFRGGVGKLSVVQNGQTIGVTFCDEITTELNCFFRDGFQTGKRPEKLNGLAQKLIK